MKITNYIDDMKDVIGIEADYVDEPEIIEV